MFHDKISRTSDVRHVKRHYLIFTAFKRVFVLLATNSTLLYVCFFILNTNTGEGKKTAVKENTAAKCDCLIGVY